MIIDFLNEISERKSYDLPQCEFHYKRWAKSEHHFNLSCLPFYLMNHQHIPYHFHIAAKLAKHTPKRRRGGIAMRHQGHQASYRTNRQFPHPYQRTTNMNNMRRRGGPPNPRMDLRDPEVNTWQVFQSEENRSYNSNMSLINTNRSPPKPIKTIRLESSTANSQNEIAPKVNFAASWLAKNPDFARTKKTEAIVVDDSFREETVREEEVVENTIDDDDDDCVVIDEPETGGKEQRKKPVEKKDFRDTLFRRGDQDEDSIIIVGEVVRTNQGTTKKTMTQLENKMESSSFWSSPQSTSSSVSTPIASTTPIFNPSVPPPQINQNRPLMKILDGFSKDCNASSRSKMVRRWSKVKVQTYPSGKLGNSPSSSKFTICSYNVLCQKTIARTNYLYRHLTNTPNYLTWAHRWKGLQEELPSFDADIIGLQEVQCDHYIEDFEPLMKKHGYEGLYKQKYGTNQKDDGCALFFRPSRFDRVAYQEVNYFISPESVSNRENIAQILALRCRITKEILIVANTHLLFNEERGQVKLAQLSILFASINKMKQDITLTGESSNPSILVMGDFNMEPNSKIYEFVVNGILHVEGQLERTMSGQSTRGGGNACKAVDLIYGITIGLNPIVPCIDTDSRELPILDGSIRHPFKFNSAYHFSSNPVVIPSNQRAISTYHKDKASPDFIFYTSEIKNGVEKLQLLEKFELPAFCTLSSKIIPWPNQHVPSDHLPIIARFELNKMQ